MTARAIGRGAAEAIEMAAGTCHEFVLALVLVPYLHMAGPGFALERPAVLGPMAGGAIVSAPCMTAFVAVDTTG